MIRSAFTALFLGVLSSLAQNVTMESVGSFHLDPSKSRETWGGGREPKAFLAENLPACFERTLQITAWDRTGGFDWVFTGPRAGIALRVKPNEVRLDQKFYDSLAITLPDKSQATMAVKILKHPEKLISGEPISVAEGVRSLALRLDHRLGLVLLVNGQEVAQTVWAHDLVHHQVVLQGAATVDFQVLQPAVSEVDVTVTPEARHQRILGFGGITCPPAYNLLSPEGRREWWRLLTEYNLLLQREYPMGSQLNAAMDNWDNLADAVPHYYGDNHVNSEVSDFNYLKTLREHGGKIMFEFWRLPVWARTNVTRYAAAVVRYCQLCQERAGGPPEIVGIQNEEAHTAETFQQMTIALRQELDDAGFGKVKIHMADCSVLRTGIQWLKMFKAKPEVWRAIDYSATHMYDFQEYFVNPDGFDTLMRTFRADSGDRPIISTELCVNSGRYQTDSYRLALQMGQLYHKNLVIADASAVAYCWLILNVEQPVYGMTRSLFVPDLQQGGWPVASSHQLRVFGAFSRKVKEGMVRIETECNHPDLLVSAFAGENSRSALIALNRSTRPIKLNLHSPGLEFTSAEVCGPYSPNRRVDPGERVVAPGNVLTLSCP